MKYHLKKYLHQWGTLLRLNTMRCRRILHKSLCDLSKAISVLKALIRSVTELEKTSESNKYEATTETISVQHLENIVCL